MKGAMRYRYDVKEPFQHYFHSARQGNRLLSVDRRGERKDTKNANLPIKNTFKVLPNRRCRSRSVIFLSSRIVLNRICTPNVVRYFFTFDIHICCAVAKQSLKSLITLITIEYL